MEHATIADSCSLCQEKAVVPLPWRNLTAVSWKMGANQQLLRTLPAEVILIKTSATVYFTSKARLAESFLTVHVQVVLRTIMHGHIHHISTYPCIVYQNIRWFASFPIFTKAVSGGLNCTNTWLMSAVKAVVLSAYRCMLHTQHNAPKLGASRS